MTHAVSAVLEYGAPEPGETAGTMADKLRFHTDSWDLSVDLKAGSTGIVVIDARSHDAYAAGPHCHGNGRVQRGSEIGPRFMRRQPHLATGRLLWL